MTGMQVQAFELCIALSSLILLTVQREVVSTSNGRGSTGAGVQNMPDVEEKRRALILNLDHFSEMEEIGLLVDTGTGAPYIPISGKRVRKMDCKKAVLSS